MNDNPAFGAGLQPFMGIPSFMRLPVSRELKDVDVAILGVPFDSGTSYRAGTRFGPRKIREASLMIWGHNSTLNVTPLKKLTVVDYGDVSVIPTSIEHTMTAITKTASEVIETGTTLITLGGDHSIALPLLRAHAKKHGPVSGRVRAHKEAPSFKIDGRCQVHPPVKRNGRRTVFFAGDGSVTSGRASPSNWA